MFYWLKNGALPTDTVRSLLQRTGLWMKWSLTKKGMDEAAIATEMEKWQMAQAEKRQRDEARKARRTAAATQGKKSCTRKRRALRAAAAPAPPAAAAGTPELLRA